MTPPYTNMGKQVLRDGRHYADAHDVPAAEAIAAALNDATRFDELYQAAHDYLYSVHRASMRASSERLSALLAELRPPETRDAA